MVHESVKASVDCRRWELDEITSWLPDEGRLLEVGAGDGLQSALLAARGLDITAVEVESDNPTWQGYQARGMFRLDYYDGVTLPYESQSFDVVYSSHVLEHVTDPAALLAECRRVLVPGGWMVMIVPTFFWRLWSIPAYYPGRVKEVSSMVWGDGSPGPPRRIRLSSFFPSTHGEKGNVVSELWWYTRWRWRHEFAQAGLELAAEAPVRLFASGEWLTNLDRRWRRRVTYLLGSTRRVFVTKALPRLP